MPESIITILGSAIISGLVALALGLKQGKKIQVDIESQYKTMLDSELEERRKDRERIKALEDKFDKLERAYGWSLYHIKRVDPNNPPPDFLEWSTGELRKYYKERFNE